MSSLKAGVGFPIGPGTSIRARVKLLREESYESSRILDLSYQEMRDALTSDCKSSLRSLKEADPGGFGDMTVVVEVLKARQLVRHYKEGSAGVYYLYVEGEVGYVKQSEYSSGGDIVVVAYKAQMLSELKLDLGNGIEERDREKNCKNQAQKNANRPRSSFRP